MDNNQNIPLTEEQKEKVERRKRILVTAIISVIMLCVLMFLLYTNGKYIQNTVIQ